MCIECADCRMGHHATNYFALLNGSKPLRLWHGRDRRLASGPQRLMLIASERGCSFPGCGSGAYFCQVHHANGDWQDGGRTDIDDLTLACERDHPLTGRGANQWKTAKRHGITSWTPPKIVNPQQRPRVNGFHHPERRMPTSISGDSGEPR